MLARPMLHALRLMPRAALEKWNAQMPQHFKKLNRKVHMLRIFNFGGAIFQAACLWGPSIKQSAA